MDAQCIVPLPRLNIAPVRLRISSCTANDASTHHSYIPCLFIDNISGKCTVAIKYLLVLANFFWSSLVGLFTLV